jgi:hypothetical protein
MACGSAMIAPPPAAMNGIDSAITRGTVKNSGTKNAMP